VAHGDCLTDRGVVVAGVGVVRTCRCTGLGEGRGGECVSALVCLVRLVLNQDDCHPELAGLGTRVP